MDLAQRILVYRAKHRLTQAEFAEIVGVKPLTIHRAEHGQIGKVTKTKIELILNEEGEV